MKMFIFLVIFIIVIVVIFAVEKKADEPRRKEEERRAHLEYLANRTPDEIEYDEITRILKEDYNIYERSDASPLLIEQIKTNLRLKK